MWKARPYQKMKDIGMVDVGILAMYYITVIFLILLSINPCANFLLCICISWKY